MRVQETHRELLRRERFTRKRLHDNSGYWMEKTFITCIGTFTIVVDDIGIWVDDGVNSTKQPSHAKFLIALLNGLKSLPKRARR